MGSATHEAYTTGGNPRLVHRRYIGEGGSGEVHEVQSHRKKVSYCRVVVRHPYWTNLSLC